MVVLKRLLGLCAALAGTALVCAAAPTYAAAPTQDSVIAEINLMRADPQGYARMLERGPHGPGVAQAIVRLKTLQPMGPLELDEHLTAAAEDHAADEGPKGKIEHTGTDGRKPMQRMRDAGMVATTYAEVISMGQHSAREVVIQLLSDEAHMNDLVDPNLKKIGVGCGGNARYGSMCVIDMSDKPYGAAPAAIVADRAEAEVLVEVATETTPEQISALDKRNGLQTQEHFDSELLGSKFLRSKVVDGRSVDAALKHLKTDKAVLSAQSDFLFTLAAAHKHVPAAHAAAPAHAEAPSLQYALGKLHAPEAHRLAKGDNVVVAVIDTGVDVNHPELRGAVAGSFDALGGPPAAHAHGTAVAGAIAAHGKLLGTAPDARILAVRAFDPASSKGVTFHILKGLDWAATKGQARIVNMSFAGPQDPALHRAVEAAWKRGVTMVAAAGNAGPKSPPLYPAAETHVIAVTATDAHDHLYESAVRGGYILVAAPGVDVLEASPDGGYQLQSGTSFSAAEISGVVALLLQRTPAMTPDQVRATLAMTSLDLPAAPGQDHLRLVNALKAVSASH